MAVYAKQAGAVYVGCSFLLTKEFTFGEFGEYQ
jgi:hypothetical protein